jgi:DNA-binding MarR family transcriptional regulator
MELKHNPGISQNEISRKLNVDKAMSARSVKKLIELGYIRKKENTQDIRAYELYITKKAEEVIPKVIEILDKRINILIEGIGINEIYSSIDFLESVLENSKNYRKKQCEGMKEN